MDLRIFNYTEQTVRINTDKRFLAIIIDCLTPYVKREVKRAAIQYEACSYREAFDQVLVKEKGVRSDKFLIYDLIIELIPEYDLAKVNE